MGGASHFDAFSFNISNENFFNVNPLANCVEQAKRTNDMIGFVADEMILKTIVKLLMPWFHAS